MSCVQPIHANGLYLILSQNALDATWGGVTVMKEHTHHIWHQPLPKKLSFPLYNGLMPRYRQTLCRHTLPFPFNLVLQSGFKRKSSKPFACSCFLDCWGMAVAPVVGNTTKICNISLEW
jgi:hypothetical protein